MILMTDMTDGQTDSVCLCIKEQSDDIYGKREFSGMKVFKVVYS